MAAKRFSTGAAVTVQPWAAFLCWVRPFVFRRWWLIWGRGLWTPSSRRRDRKFCVRLRSVILALCNGIRILRKPSSEGECALMDPQVGAPPGAGRPPIRGHFRPLAPLVSRQPDPGWRPASRSVRSINRQQPGRGCRRPSPSRLARESFHVRAAPEL